MIYLFHGEDHARSRSLVRAQIDAVIRTGGEIRELTGDKITKPELESTLSTESLFGTESLVIENIFSRLKSREKDACISLLTDYAGPKNIFIWEKKEVTKATLAKPPKTWKLVLSKPPAIIFNFQDALYPGNLSNILKLLADIHASVPDVLTFTMITRQITNLIIIKSSTSPKFPPWQLSKLKTLASKWSEHELVTFHDELIRIDYQIKSGNTKLNYATQLDILLATLLR